MTSGSGASDVPPDDGVLSAGELARIASEVLESMPFPALVLEVPSERIVAASPGATRLVDPDGGSIVGHVFEEFTLGRPVVGMDLLAGGRLNGFETFRMLRRGRGAAARVRMWIRSFDHQPASRFVLVVLVADDEGDLPHERDWQEAPAVVGTADATLLIERVSNDAETLFHRPISQLLGEPLVSLVTEEGVPSLLSGLEQASASNAGITLYLDMNPGPESTPMRCEVLLLPLEPSPSCAFVFLPTPAITAGHDSGDLSTILRRLSRGAQVAELARGVFRGITDASMPGLSRLTTRELEIVTRLLEGDRPPAIATKLYLSQSTIRNHLASVFAKLGVTSQQELLELMRHRQSGHGGS